MYLGLSQFTNTEERLKCIYFLPIWLYFLLVRDSLNQGLFCSDPWYFDGCKNTKESVITWSSLHEEERWTYRRMNQDSLRSSPTLWGSAWNSVEQNLGRHAGTLRGRERNHKQRHSLHLDQWRNQTNLVRAEKSRWGIVGDTVGIRVRHVRLKPLHRGLDSMHYGQSTHSRSFIL